MATIERYAEPFPWRTATLIASAIAAAELLGLFVIGAFVLAHPFRHHAKAHATSTTAAVVRHHTPTAHRHVVPVPAKDRFAPVLTHSLRPRANVRVLVLNANGVQGAAHAEAARLQGLGYVIGGAANASGHHYARSMVMFVPGYQKEARRIARETGIKLVAPVDGITPSTLSASRLVVLLGN